MKARPKLLPTWPLQKCGRLRLLAAIDLKRPNRLPAVRLTYSLAVINIHGGSDPAQGVRGVDGGREVLGRQVVEQVERAAHAGDAFLHHVEVDHGGVGILVTKQQLHRTDVVALFKQMRGEAMAERVTRHAFDYLGSPRRQGDGPLQCRFVQMVPAHGPSPRNIFSM